MAVLILDGKILADQFFQNVQVVENSGKYDVVSFPFDGNNIVLKSVDTEVEAEEHIDFIGDKLIASEIEDSPQYINARVPKE